MDCHVWRGERRGMHFMRCSSGVSGCTAYENMFTSQAWLSLSWVSFSLVIVDRQLAIFHYFGVFTNLKRFSRFSLKLISALRLLVLSSLFVFYHCHLLLYFSDPYLSIYSTLYQGLELKLGIPHKYNAYIEFWLSLQTAPNFFTSSNCNLQGSLLQKRKWHDDYE